jgi:hypothetical protein
MRSRTATLILWMRAEGHSEEERMVDMAKRANVLDHVEKACRIEDIGTIVVVSNSGDMKEDLTGYPVICETDADLNGAFFGPKLQMVLEKHAVETALYVGGGSGVFMEIDEMARWAQTGLAWPDRLVVNNFYSTDFAAFGRSLNLRGLRRCERDNQIGWVLGREEGTRTCVLPSCLSTRFDIDTPADLMILKAHPVRGRHLSEMVSRLPIDPSPLLGVMDMLVRRDREVIVAGRIPLEIAASFDRDTACHLRFYVEERGMETRGCHTGSWTLLGVCLEELGIPGFFRTLSTHTDAAILDSRVLFRHLGLRPSRRDRFLSDLFKPEEIADASLRVFTEAAIDSPIPVVFGGHTLVSGGLYAVLESAWQRAGKPVRRGTEEFPHEEWVTDGVECPVNS